jgi:acyl carrier protein
MGNTTADEITGKLLAVLRQHLRFLSDNQEFPMDTDLDKLGLDSMSAINLLLDLEQTFGIRDGSRICEKTNDLHVVTLSPPYE